MAYGINRGIIDCVNNGSVSAVSVSVNGAAFADAVGFIKCKPSLNAGLHITLTGEKALLASKEIESLSGNDGNLPGNYLVFLLKYFSRRIKASDIEKEIHAQFKKFSDAGLKIRHVNSHQHLHIVPGVLEIVIRACRAHGVLFIRCPYSRPGRHWLSARLDKVILQFILNIFCYLSAAKIRSAGLKTYDNTSGILFSGKLRSSEIKMLLSSFKNGLSELICHPAYVDKELLSSYGFWGYSWAEERSLLSRSEIKALLKNEGFFTAPLAVP